MTIWLAEIWRAWRASLRRPGFLLLASGVLALGIGASVAVSTLIQNALLRPLPVAQASQLVAVGPLDGDRVSAVSPQMYQALAGMSGVASQGLVEGFAPPVNIAGTGEPQLIPALHADHGFLATLGVRMALGRNFSAIEDAPHGPSAVILAWGFWQRHYGGRADVIGRSLKVEGVAHAIVGVLPMNFALPGFSGDILLPLALPAVSQSDGTNYLAVARLADGTTGAAVAIQTDTRLHALMATWGGGEYWQQRRFGVQGFTAYLHADDRPVLMLFLASALFLLAIAWINLANLMLMRSLARQHELSVRDALGAPSLRLWLPMLAEGALVGAVGALAGVVSAVVGLALVQGVIPADWLVGGLQPHIVTACLAVLLGMLAALLATMLGLWRARSVTTADELREGGRAGPDRRGSRLGRILVVAQVALATALLSTAGVFLHTLYDAARTPLGFDSQGILTFELAPVKADYADGAAVHDLARRLLTRLRRLPGVAQVTVTTNLPAGGFTGQFNMPVHVPGGEASAVQFRGVGTAFLDVFGIHLRAGHGFAPGDKRGSEQVAVVNQVLADHEFAGQALGKLIQQGSGDGMWSARIVGVVADTSQFGPLGPQPPVLYLPLEQMPDHILQIFRSFEPLRFALKVHGVPEAYGDAVRKAVAEVAPEQPIANLQSMQRIVHDTTARMRLNLLLIGIFAALALLLAAAGLYAVMAVAVAAREREFGVRSALGAAPSRLTRLVLRSGLAQIAVGLLLGVGLALLSSRLLHAVLEQVDRSAFDPLALFGVCVLLAIAGLLACLLPALRAGRVHPMRALRGE